MRYFASHGEGRSIRRLRERERRCFAARRRHASRGQSLVIFALSLTALIAILGLAIDTVRIYDLYARMQRAAEGAALAGVLYMPSNYATAYTSPGDGNSAVSRALQEAVKNGFGKLST
jgi:Flp pilus assembly protein TadG